MGKKKSKTAKQKQAKKQQASKSKFGGASRGRERNSGQQSALSLTTITRAKQQRNKKSKNHTKQQKHPFAPLSPSSKKTKTDTEHADFDKQMASAQERQSEEQHAKLNKNKKKHTPSFAPATFIVDDNQKSTSRLLQETTSKIHSGLEGIGSKAAKPLLQSSLSLAAGTTASWSATVTNESSVLESNNPYAALECNSDENDDDETQQPLLQPTLPLFRFAPPTFAVSAGNDDDDDDDDVDPDL